MSQNNMPQVTKHYEEKVEYHSGNDSKDIWQPYFNLYKLKQWENLYEISIYINSTGLKLLNESIIGQIITDNYNVKKYDEELIRIKFFIDLMYQYLYFRRNDYCFVVKQDVLMSQTSLQEIIYNDKFQYLRINCHEPFNLSNMSSIIEFIKICLTQSLDNYKNVILININNNLDEVRDALQNQAILNNSIYYSKLYTHKLGTTSSDRIIENYSKLIVNVKHTPFQEQKERYLVNQEMMKLSSHANTMLSKQKFVQEKEKILAIQKEKLADWKLVQNFTAQNMQIRSYSDKYIAKKRELVKILKRIYPKQQFTKLANQNTKLLQSQTGAEHETALQSFLSSKTFINIDIIDEQIQPQNIESVFIQNKISEIDEINQFNAREQIQIAQSFQDYVVRLNFFNLSNINCTFEYLKNGKVQQYQDIQSNIQSQQFFTEIVDNSPDLESTLQCTSNNLITEEEQNMQEILEFIQRMNNRAVSRKPSKLVYQAETFVNQQLMLKTPFNMKTYDDMIVFIYDCNRNKNIGYFYINQNVTKNGIIKITHDKISYFDKYYLYNEIHIIIK